MTASLAVLLFASAQAGAQGARQLLGPQAYINERQIRWGDQILDAEELVPPAQPIPGRSVPTAMAGFWAYNSKRWPNGEVPILFQETIPEHRRRLFFDVCAQWSRRAPVRCVARKNEGKYLSVYEGLGCYATVGLQNFGNSLSLGDGCWDTGVMLHEIGHALGLMHEHQRSDRDWYITIHWENIDPAGSYNYVALQMNDPAIRGAVPRYDFTSIMHYGPSFFSANGEPAFSLKPGYERFQGLVGRQQGLSDMDGRTMAAFYGAGRGPTPQPPTESPTRGEDHGSQRGDDEAAPSPDGGRGPGDNAAGPSEPPGEGG